MIGFQILDVVSVCLFIIDTSAFVLLALSLEAQNLFVELQDMNVEILFIFLLLVHPRLEQIILIFLQLHLLSELKFPILQVMNLDEQ